MNTTLQALSTQLGINIFLLLFILIWSLVWKLIALWKSARKGHLGWFIILALVNLIGLLEILYVFFFSEMSIKKKNSVKKKKISKKKR